MKENMGELDKVKKGILAADTIYDILVVLYISVDTNDSPLYIKNYLETKTKDSDMAEDYIKVGQIINELLDLGISFDLFKYNLIILLKQTADFRNICIDILLCFDQILGEREAYPFLSQNKKMGLRKIYSNGPLNQENLEYGLYLMPEKGIADRSPVLRKNRILHFRDESKVISLLNRYTIVRNRGGEPQVIIKGYSNSHFETCFQKDTPEIKIAVIPFYNEKWYKEIYERCEDYEKRNYFSIEEDTALTEIINQSYIRILEEMNLYGVDIVVFPELAMTGSTKQMVRDWLAEQCLRDGDFNIKLVFMGSYWDNDKKSNCCTLLSATGIPLVENYKKIGFTLKDNGIKYYEDLQQRPDKQELIDIKGLGRVLYFVCRDALEEVDQAYLQNEYYVNAEVISCYSVSISYFESAMKRFSQTQNGISVVANCCEARKQEKKIGFIALPATNMNSGNNSAEGIIFHYDIADSCMENCKLGKCQCVYSLYPMKTWEKNGYVTIAIEKNWFQF